MRTIVLISGNGTNLQALINANIPISLVVSNKESAHGLDRAKRHHIPTLLCPFHKSKQSRIEYDTLLSSQILQFGEPDLIVLAGFMHILSGEFIRQFKCIINLHPALPGTFVGLHALERGFEAFRSGSVKQTGIMVHKVIEEVDAGEVILSRIVPITDQDTLASYEARMHEAEHELIVEAVLLLKKEFE